MRRRLRGEPARIVWCLQYEDIPESQSEGGIRRSDFNSSTSVQFLPYKEATPPVEIFPPSSLPTKSHDPSRRHNTMRAAPVSALPLLLLLVVALSARGVDAFSFSSLRVPSPRRRPVPDPACKTVDTVEGLDLRAWTSHPWYVQEQQVVRYQPLDNFYCVRARYTLNDAGDEVEVYNSARRGGVDGEDTNARGMRLRAVLEDKDASTSKLLVGPAFLPRFTYGPYWIVAVSPDVPDPELGYEWAIVSGGAPTRLTDQENGLCSTGDGTNDSGLWLFTREPAVGADVVEVMRATARDAGFDTSVLKPVTQEGCEYPE